MKILILFSGQVRPISPLIFNESLKLFTEGYDVDIGLTYWDKPGLSMNHDIQKTTKIEFDVEDYLSLAFDSFNLVSEDKVYEQSFNNLCINPCLLSNELFNPRTKNSLKQLFMISKSLDVPQIQNYDVVIRSRFDSIFLTITVIEAETSEYRFISTL